MALHLTSADLDRVAAASRTLLAPLAAPDVDAWREAAMRAVCEVLGAETAAFLMPGQPRPYVVYQLDEAVIEPMYAFTGPRWCGTGRSVEPELDLFHDLIVRHGFEAWDMTIVAALFGLGDARPNNLFYNEVLAPNRMTDTHSLMVPTPSGTAHLMAQHVRRPHEPGENLPLLRLLAPSFKAALDAVDRLAAHRAALDAVDEPLAAYDANGRLLHRTPALERLLTADPHRARVEAAAGALARRAAHLAFPRPGRGGEAAPPPARAEAATPTARYALRATVLGTSPFGPDGAVLVMAERVDALPLPTVEAVRSRHGLSPREAEVALLLAEGLTNDAVATRLCISPHTARRHTEAVMRKLLVETRAAIAVRLLQPE